MVPEEEGFSTFKIYCFRITKLGSWYYCSTTLAFDRLTLIDHCLAFFHNFIYRVAVDSLFESRIYVSLFFKNWGFFYLNLIILILSGVGSLPLAEVVWTEHVLGGWLHSGVLEVRAKGKSGKRRAQNLSIIIFSSRLKLSWNYLLSRRQLIPQRLST